MSSNSSSASSSKWTFAIIAVAATALIAVSAFAYNSSQTSNKSNLDFDKNIKDNTPIKNTSKTTDVAKDAVEDVAEDVDEDDEDEDEDDDEDHRKKIEDSIQSASSLAAKYFQGGKYKEAINKYSDAIELATNATWYKAKDTIQLYANRSAVYEKAADYNNSLLDVETVLMKEVTNTKARIRKARILEAQNNVNEALYELFVVLNIIMKTASTTTAPTKALEESLQTARNSIDSLSKVVAANEVKSYMSQKFHQKLPKDLPIRSACRSYFELTPTFHQWQCLYKGNKRHSYENKNDKITLEQKLVLVYYDIANGFYKNAFDELDSINPEILVDESNSNVILSQYYEMKGTERHLKGDAKAAISLYEKAIEIDSNNYIAAIKLASVYGQENDDKVKANEIYNGLLANIELNDIQAAIKSMFVQLNMASLPPTKDEVTGQPRTEDLHKNITAINDIINIAQKFPNDQIVKSGHFLALVRKIMAHAHLKLLSVLPEDTNINEEKAKVEQFFGDMITEAKELCPENEVILSIEADICTLFGDVEKALRLMDEVKDKAPNYDSSPYTAKANILTQKMHQCQQQYYESGGNTYYISSLPQIIEEITVLYKHAIDQESNNVEAYFHYANFQVMNNDFESANKNIIEAFNYLRNKEEVSEIMTLKVQVDMQLKTIDYLKKKNLM